MKITSSETVGYAGNVAPNIVISSTALGAKVLKVKKGGVIVVVLSLLLESNVSQY